MWESAGGGGAPVAWGVRLCRGEGCAGGCRAPQQQPLPGTQAGAPTLACGRGLVKGPKWVERSPLCWK